MDAPNTTDWITAIATVVIPIASVVLAHRVTTEHYRTIATMELFRNIMLHCQQLKHEMLDMFQAKSACANLRALIERNNNIKNAILQAPPDDPRHLIASLESVNEMEKNVMAQIQIQDEIYASSFKSARYVEAQIDTDLLSLEFLLQNKGNRCGTAVLNLLKFFVGYDFRTSNKSEFDNFQQQIQNHIQAVVDEVRKLQKLTMPDDT